MLFIRLINQFNQRIALAICWCNLLLVLLTFSIVILRYFFGLGWIALQESLLYLHASIFLLVAAYALSIDAHVRVDIIYQKLSAYQRQWLDVLGHVFLLLPVVILVLISSYPYVSLAWHIQEGSNASGGLDGVFLLKTLIPVGMLLLGLQSVASIAAKIIAICLAKKNI